MDHDQHNLDPTVFRRAQESFAKFGAKCLMLMSGIMYGAETQYATVERWHYISNNATGLEDLSIMAKELPDPGTVTGLASLALLPCADAAYQLGQQPSHMAAAFASAGSVYTMHAAHLYLDNIKEHPRFLSIEKLKAREAHVIGSAIVAAEASYIAASHVPLPLSLLASLAACSYAAGYYAELRSKINRIVD